MKHISIPLFLLGLALSALPASAGAPGAAADSLRAMPTALERFYQEPFVYAPSDDPGPLRNYSGLFLFTASTALANALVITGGAHSDALAAGGLVFGVLSLLASASERTQARPVHFALGVTSIVLSLMNISNAPDTRGPADVQSGTSYKGPPLGLSLSF